MQESDDVSTALRALLFDILGADFDDGAPLHRELSLVFDLGLESLELVELLERLRRQFGFGLEAMTEQLGAAWTDIAALNVGHVIDFVQQTRQRDTVPDLTTLAVRG